MRTVPGGPADRSVSPGAADPWTTIEPALGRLAVWARHLVRDPDDASDLVQDVVLRLHDGLDRFRGGDLDAWLFRVTKNVFIDGYRRRRRRREDELPAWAACRITDPACVEDDVLGAEQRRAVRRALLDLPAALRAAVVLRDLEGRSYLEIARLMRVPPGTARSRVHRGRRRLQSALGDVRKPA